MYLASVRENSEKSTKNPGFRDFFFTIWIDTQRETFGTDLSAEGGKSWSC